ncbi:aspartate/glutamate racemase family protein [Pokkaliibacter sp. MBI-7]|uniref:aspartate/glutamate racemase family protein n=1 Tax=Pokkaliibacter sp. MBI-7 TaxID=3040600 RepID=UPI002446F9E1|nr:aspartate/glutamate racemase family protein [Pokkaliibacter sp. MBI-7]MDH2433748.1 aspartate/glutamate racemase family protein [Pokkaliibacter sp. MBI-7]
MQKTIGLIGGMSWESTAVYYKEINELIRQRYGLLRSADVLMHSVNFETVIEFQKSGRWDKAADYLAGIGRGLAGAGADCILICTNTMHLVAGQVAAAVDVPLIHIVDVTAEALLKAGVRRPLLLATRYTMEQDFYLGRMRERYGLNPMVPEAADREVVHEVIFDELCGGIVSESSRQAYLDIIERGRQQGADAVILGCTEIGLLIEPQHTRLPQFDSTKLHAQAAVDFACGTALALTA